MFFQSPTKIEPLRHCTITDHIFYRTTAASQRMSHNVYKKESVDDLDCILGEVVSDELEPMTESPQQRGCLQDLLDVIPAPTNDAGSMAGLAPRKQRTGELLGGGPCRALLYFSLTQPQFKAMPPMLNVIKLSSTSKQGWLRKAFIQGNTVGLYTVHINMFMIKHLTCRSTFTLNVECSCDQKSNVNIHFKRSMVK